MALSLTGFFGPHDRAQVFLQTSAQSPRQLSGIVLFKGAAVSEGTVHLVLENPKKDRYLASANLPVGEDGEFWTSGDELLVFGDSNKKPPPLRVTATFVGQQPGEKKDKAPTTVQGKATLYLNYPAPAGKWMTWGSAIIAALLAISLLSLFTGELKTRRRARQLFSITYIMCFVSLSVPIWAIAVVSKSEHAVDMMEQAPIGLIKGTAKGVQRPQWLVNVGGAVVPTQEETGAPPAKVVQAKEPEMGHPSSVEAPTATPSATPQQSPTKEETSAPPAKVVPAKEPLREPPSSVEAPTATPSATPQQSPTPQENIALDEPRQVPGFALVRGGLAVPFYVIILAVLGAGINMTKNVPDIQKDFNCKVHLEDEEPFWKRFLKAPMTVVPTREQGGMDPEQAAIVSEIRKDLINNYMGLISAPFLAIAVYYLLQVVATNVAEPVLVVVSFATGFISHNIIRAITRLAIKTLNGGEEGEEGKQKEGEEGKQKEGEEGKQKDGKEGKQKDGKEGKPKDGKEGKPKDGEPGKPKI